MNRRARRAHAKAARDHSNQPPQSILRTTAEVLISQREPDSDLKQLIAETFDTDVIYIDSRCAACREVMNQEHVANTVAILTLTNGQAVLYAQCRACTERLLAGDTDPTDSAGEYLERVLGLDGYPVEMAEA